MSFSNKLWKHVPRKWNEGSSQAQHLCQFDELCDQRLSKGGEGRTVVECSGHFLARECTRQSWKLCVMEEEFRIITYSLTRMLETRAPRVKIGVNGNNWTDHFVNARQIAMPQPRHHKVHDDL